MNDESWAKALAEFESSERQPGLWARCFAEANGNEAQAKAAYLRERAASPALYKHPRDKSSESILGKCPNCGFACAMDAEKCSFCGAPFGDSEWRPIAVIGEDPPPPPPIKTLSDNDPTEMEQPRRRQSGWVTALMWLGGGFAAFLAFGFYLSSTPEGKAKNVARSAIDSCWSEQGRKSLDAGTARFVASTCERMTRDFREKFGVEP